MSNTWFRRPHGTQCTEAGLNPAFETPGYFQASLRTRRGERRQDSSCPRLYLPMRRLWRLIAGLLLMTTPLPGQGKRLWVLRAPGEMVEYDATTFAVKQTIKVPPEAVQSPSSVRVNRTGQILFATPVPLPLAEEDVAKAQKAWLWNGRSATTIDAGVTREVHATGSNCCISTLASMPSRAPPYLF